VGRQVGEGARFEGKGGKLKTKKKGKNKQVQGEPIYKLRGIRLQRRGERTKTPGLLQNDGGTQAGTEEKEDAILSLIT